MSSCSDTEHSETGKFQEGSEDSALEHEKIQQRKNKKKTCKKRKRVKKVVSDGENSSETEAPEQVTRASKKRRITDCDQAPNHTDLQQKTNISSDDETEEKSPVNENSLVPSNSSGAETEERKSPVKGDSISDSKGKENDSDSSTSQDKPVKNERGRGSKKQKVSENEEHSPSHPHSPFSKYFPGEGSGSKQRSSDSSDDTSDTDERNKSLSQIKKSQHNRKSSSEGSLPLDNSETAKIEELKSDGKKLKHEAEKKTEKEDSLSSSSEPLSKYSDNRQKSVRKNVQHTSSASSDSASDSDEKMKSMPPRKKSQSSEESASESSTPPGIVDKKQKRKSDGKRFKNKTQKNPGKAEKTNPKIERLKKYLRVAGLRVRSYQKLWEDCKTNKAKIEKLLQMLIDAGLKGKPTLQKCKRLQAKRERKEEVESLDVGNIITSERGRPKRNTPNLFMSQHTTNTEENFAKRKGNSSFSRIKNVVDSEESE